MIKITAILFILITQIGFSHDVDSVIKVVLNLEREYTKKISIHNGSIEYQIEKGNLVVETDSVDVHFFDVTIDIVNTSDKTIQIWMMTCSWNDFLIVNNKYIRRYYQGCDLNSPFLYDIGPNSKLSYNGTYVKQIKFDYPDNVSIYGRQVELTKIGLILIDDIFEPKVSWFEYGEAKDDLSTHRVIWSNGINFFGDQGIPFHERFKNNQKEGKP